MAELSWYFFTFTTIRNCVCNERETISFFTSVVINVHEFIILNVWVFTLHHAESGNVRSVLLTEEKSLFARRLEPRAHRQHLKDGPKKRKPKVIVKKRTLVKVTPRNLLTSRITIRSRILKVELNMTILTMPISGEATKNDKRLCI
jgi:hypothetical protein